MLIDLPNELLLHLIRFMYVEDIVRLKMTCIDMNVKLNYEIIWKAVYNNIKLIKYDGDIYKENLQLEYYHPCLHLENKSSIFDVIDYDRNINGCRMRDRNRFIYRGHNILTHIDIVRVRINKYGDIDENGEQYAYVHRKRLEQWRK